MKCTNEGILGLMVSTHVADDLCEEVHMHVQCISIRTRLGPNEPEPLVVSVQKKGQLVFSGSVYDVTYYNCIT